MNATETPGRHFPGCCPDDDQAPETPEGYQPADPENCWHCGTGTPRGCGCWDCLDAEYIPPEAIYHCPVCKRWWAYMTGLNITTITLESWRQAAGDDHQGGAR